jgi:cell division protein FtsQ
VWQDIKMLNATADVLFGMLALALLVTSFWWLAQRPMFALKVIRIEGTAEVPLRYVNRSTVKGTAVPRIKGNFFTVNLDAVRTAFESVPWVRKATVRREWPNKLIVTLEEHIPLGTWGEDGRLLSVKGDVFTANLAEAEEDGELPALAGPIGSEKEVVEVFRDLHDWFAPARLKPASLRLSGRYAWTVGLDNGMKVELGREQSRETLKARVDRLMGIYPQLVARLQDRIESIDMRYPNGLALTARGLTIESDVKNKQ